MDEAVLQALTRQNALPAAATAEAGQIVERLVWGGIRPSWHSPILPVEADALARDIVNIYLQPVGAEQQGTFPVPLPPDIMSRMRVDVGNRDEERVAESGGNGFEAWNHEIHDIFF